MRMAIRNKRGGGGGRLQLVIFPVLLLLMAAAVFLVMRFATKGTHIKFDVPVYQYFLDQRADYSARTKVISGESGVIFEEDGQQNESDSTPIYTVEEKAFFLPADMSWMDLETGMEWRVPAFGKVRLDEDGKIWYTDKDTQVQLAGGFLSDGRGTFVFLDNVTLMFNNLAYSAGPLSFYSTAKGMYRIYRYEEDELISSYERTGNTAIQTERGYQADLTAGIYTAVNGTQRLLVASPAVLRSIGER